MDISSVVSSLSALAQPTRLRVFQLLASRGGEGINAGDIAKLIETPQNTMSAHLAVLARAGLVRAERQGRQISYTAEMAALRALTAFLDGSGNGDRND